MQRGDVDLLAGVKAVYANFQSRIITETGPPIADEMLYPSNLPSLMTYLATTLLEPFMVDGPRTSAL